MSDLLKGPLSASNFLWRFYQLVSENPLKQGHDISPTVNRTRRWDNRCHVRIQASYFNTLEGVRRPNDGLDGQALPLLPPASVAPCAAVHRNGHHGRADSWRCAPASSVQRPGAPAGPATGRQRAQRPRAVRCLGPDLGRDKSRPNMLTTGGSRSGVLTIWWTRA